MPDACVTLDLAVDGPATIIGAGNGDPAFRDVERPADGDRHTFTIKTFNGLAQVLVKAGAEAGDATLTVSGEGIAPAKVVIATR